MRSLARVAYALDVKEKIMSQNQQYKKVKLYRTLKVVFYMLGLPLFLCAVFFSAVKFIGHDPFVGTSEVTNQLGIFTGFEKLITSPALYGVWIAFGIWLIISIVHIVLSKTVKNPRARMFAVVAVCMAVMLGTAFCMDAVFDAKIDKMRDNAPEGVTINDYKTQLSYYRTISSNLRKRSETLQLIERIDLLEKVYNVEMQGSDKGGNTENIASKPITYYNIIGDDGEVGVDISFEQGENGLWTIAADANNNIVADGEITKDVEGNQIVRLAPNSNGQLVINGKVYSHYYAIEKPLKSGVSSYVWYAKDMMPIETVFGGEWPKVTKVDGVYGLGLYNMSGLFSDGWVFSFDNMLRVLEDYYEGQEIIAKYDADGVLGKEIHEMAVDMRDIYYNGGQLDNGDQLDPETAAWMIALYNQEVDMNERFSLTRGELDLLLSKVGALLGKNSLFDFLLQPVEGGEEGDTGIDQLLGNAGLGSVADIIKPILTQLRNGMSLAGIVNNADTMKTVIDIVKAVTGYTGDINDLYVMLAYDGATDAMGIERKNLYVAIVKDDGNGAMGTDSRKVENGGDVLIDIDFSDAIIDEATGDYAFDLDHLSAFLNKAIDGLLKHFNVDLRSILVDNTIGSLLGGLLIKDIEVDGVVYKGLVISGISIPLFDQNYNAKIDIIGILENLLSGLYSYQSAVIMPVWEFYERIESQDDTFKTVAKAYAQFERAQYEATVHGSMIGSTLIGDTLGTGTYSSSFGLSDLASVRQVQTDLSYKPEYYPLYSLRDMLMLFTGIVVLFYFLSFIAAQKEEEYATGKAVVAEKKRKKSKKNKNDDSQIDEQTIDAPLTDVEQENAALPEQQNNEKEAL